jgi:serine/threonine-protein kinase
MPAEPTVEATSPPEMPAEPVVEPMFPPDMPPEVAVAPMVPPAAVEEARAEAPQPDVRPGAAEETTSPPAAAQPEPARPASRPAASRKASVLPIVIGGGVTLAVVVAAGLWYMFGRGGHPDPALQAPAAAPVGSVAETRAALDAGLASVGCTWLNVADVSQRGSGITVALRGVAGNPEDAKAQIGKLLAAKNQNGVTVDFQDVAPISGSECGPLDALRQIRDPNGGHIAIPTRQFEMTRQTTGNYAGSVAAKAIVNFNLADPNLEMALFGIEPSGKIAQLTSQRSELVGGSEDLGNNQYRLTIDVNHAGWSGLLLLTGQKPFDGSLLTGPAGSRTGDWSDRFLSEARERGWKSEMVWFKTVDDQPDQPAAPPS